MTDIDNHNLWLELLKYHGVPTVLIFVGIYVFVKYWIPLKKEEIAAAKDMEAKRLEADANHRADLVVEIKLSREEANAKEIEIRRENKEAQDRMFQMFKEMISTIRAGLDENTKELRRNSALTVASAEILGAQKKAVERRAEQLSPGDEKS